MPFIHRTPLYRVRSRWRTGSVAACFTWPANESATTTYTPSAYGNDVVYEEKMPDWKKRIRLGVNATTRFVADNRQFIYVPGEILMARQCKATNHIAYLQIVGNLAASVGSLHDLPEVPSSIVNQNALRQAIQRAHSDARAKQGALKGSTFIAELRDTIRGIRNPAKAIRRGIDDYAQAARRNARRANGGRSVPRNPNDFRRLSDRRQGAIRRAISGTWLEHSFGWIPLANDIGDAIVSGIRLSRRTPRARFSGRGLEETDPDLATVQVSDTDTLIKWQVSTYHSESVRIYGAVKLELATPATSAQEEFGLATKDFLPAVWEAIPYSFLVDYFTNIGDIVNALSFPKIDTAWVSRTFKNSSIRDCTRARVLNTGEETTFVKFWMERGVPSTYYWSRSVIDRIEYGDSLPLPSFVVEIPGSKNWRKWLNIAALATQKVL
jgi:hypothetical protein